MTTQNRSISRRTFQRRCLLAATSMSGMSAVLRAEPTPVATRTVPRKYVDVHVHLGQPWNERGPLTSEMLLGWMDAHEVEQAWVLSLVSPESWFYPITPQWVLEQTAPYRDRLIPFCGVDPRSINLGGYKGMLDILRRYVDAGAKGFGEHKWGGAIDDPRNIDLFRACAELKLPVLFHMDSQRNTDQAGLPGLEKVLQEVPNGVFIGHAQGWWASISGNVKTSELQSYPKTPVAPGGAIDRLMDKYPNLYGDLSAGSGANAIRRDPEFGRAFLIRRADRLFFGTDYLANNQEVPQFELFESLDLPLEVQKKIFHKNARNLLRQ
ncbi:MAG: amidohydrolase family protein [Planctomycetes bacterium]|nr:amidohydrolase family protein [Planctomycetota bacterium]